MIKATAKRFNSIRCGRRFGKDVLLQDVLIEPALTDGMPVAWFAPIYKDLEENWRDITNLLNPVIVRANATEKRIELVTGGSIDMWSLQDKDSGRGRKYRRVVINEASKVKDLQYSWEYVISVTLTDMLGDAFIGGTPKGFNYFHTLCGNGDSKPDWKEFHYTTFDNPHIDRSELDRMRRDYPERVFRQEILAEFIEDGSYFQNVDACAVIEQPDTPNQHIGHTVVMGVDWAKSQDFTVLTVGCRQCNRVVDWQRFNLIDYHYQRGRLIELSKKWGMSSILAESNSIGEPNIDELRRSGLPVTGFATTATSKPDLIESLHMALVRDGLKVPKDYGDELRMYEIEMMTSGRPRFSAPSGEHDDRVMSLALCWREMTQGHGWADVDELGSVEGYRSRWQ